jgi:hypothetical protein
LIGPESVADAVEKIACAGGADQQRRRRFQADPALCTRALIRSTAVAVAAMNILVRAVTRWAGGAVIETGLLA